MEIDEEKTPYPDGYEDIQEQMLEAHKRLGSLQALHDGSRDSKGPAPRLKPTPGLPGPRDYDLRTADMKKAALKAQMDELKRDTMARIDKRLANAPEADQKLIKAKVLQEFYPNDIRKMRATEKDQVNRAPKDMERSQQMADTHVRDVQNDSPEKGEGAKGAIFWKREVQPRLDRVESFAQNRDDQIRDARRQKDDLERD